MQPTPRPKLPRLSKTQPIPDTSLRQPRLHELKKKGTSPQYTPKIHSHLPVFNLIHNSQYSFVAAATKTQYHTRFPVLIALLSNVTCLPRVSHPCYKCISSPYQVPVSSSRNVAISPYAASPLNLSPSALPQAGSVTGLTVTTNTTSPATQPRRVTGAGFHVVRRASQHNL